MVHGRLAPGKIVSQKIAPYANPNHNPNPYLWGICFGEIFRGGEWAIFRSCPSIIWLDVKYNWSLPEADVGLL